MASVSYVNSGVVAKKPNNAPLSLVEEDFLNCCALGDIRNFKKFLSFDPSLLYLKNFKGESVLEIIVKSRQSILLDYLSLHEKLAVKDTLKDQPELLFLAFEQQMIVFIEHVTETNKELLYVLNAEKENLFLAACKAKNLRLMKHFYHLDHGVFKVRDAHKQTPFTLLLAHHASQPECLTWLTHHTKYTIRHTNEAQAFAEYVQSQGRSWELLFPKIVNKSTLHLFIPYIQLWLSSLENEDVNKYLEKLIAPYPNDFFYKPTEGEALEGEDLIRFCDAQIPDEMTIQNPFKDSIRQFLSIKKIEYVAQMSFDDRKISRKEANKQKMEDLRKCRSLFRKVKDFSDFQKKYLVKILKHLAVYMRTKPGADERIIFLKDFVAAEPYCATHISTVFRSIYSRISGNEVFSSRQVKSDNPAQIFQDKISKYFKEALCSKLREENGDLNIHSQYIVQKLLKEGDYPLTEDPIIDDENLVPKLLLFRQELLGIDFTNEDPEYLNSEELLFEDTKIRYKLWLKERVLNLEFIFQITAKFLLDELCKPNSEVFLQNFTAWLTEKNIKSHSVLSYDEDGYKLRKEGVLKILSKFPKRIEIF